MMISVVANLAYADDAEDMSEEDIRAQLEEYCTRSPEFTQDVAIVSSKMRDPVHGETMQEYMDYVKPIMDHNNSTYNILKILQEVGCDNYSDYINVYGIKTNVERRYYNNLADW